MSGESNMDHTDVKTIIINNNHEKLASVGATCRSSVVDCFKNKCMKFFTKQSDDKSVRAYNTFNTTGKTFLKIF